MERARPVQSHLARLAVTLTLVCIARGPASASPTHPTHPTHPTPTDRADGSWTDVPFTPEDVVPGGRSGHTLVYDAQSDRAVLYGGTSGAGGLDEVWTLALDASHMWARQTLGAGPAPRYNHTAVYDPVRHRMIVFGGHNADLFGDVWALSLDGGLAWTQLTPAGTPPSARYGHSAIYDPQGDRMIVFGGVDVSGTVADLWELTLSGTPAWSQLTPTGDVPPLPAFHSAVLDTRRHRMLVFGGNANTTDVWSLSLDASPAWSQITGISGMPPQARRGHVAAYDSLTDQMIVASGDSTGRACDTPGVEGYMCYSVTRNTGALQLGSAPVWITESAAAVGGESSAGFFDPIRRHLVVNGGQSTQECHMYFCRDWPNGIQVGFSVATWDLSIDSPTSWSIVTPANVAPSNRIGHSLVYDSRRDRMILFGGQVASPVVNDTWALAPDHTWSMVIPSGVLPPARYLHAAVYDSLHDRMIVFGGNTGGGAAQDVWQLTFSDPPTWSELHPLGGPPPARWSHAAAFDGVRNQLVIFGGYSGAMNLADTWKLSLGDTPAWSQPFGSAPGARRDASLIADPARDRLILFGGITNAAMNDCHAYSLASDTWQPLVPAGDALPSARLAHSAVYDRVNDRMVVFGGSLSFVETDVLWGLSLGDVVQWTQLLPNDARLSPTYAGCAFDAVHGDMVVVDGYNHANAISLWQSPAPGTPHLTSVTPGAASLLATLTLTLHGTGLNEFGTIALSGDGASPLVVGPLRTVDDTTVTVVVDPRTADPGLRTVRFTNPGGARDSLPDAVRFSLPATVSVHAPAGGEQFAASSLVTVRWGAIAGSRPIDHLLVDFSSDGGATFAPVATVGAMDTSLVWTTPFISTYAGVIRVTAVDVDGVTGASANPPFSVIGGPGAPVLTSVSPVAGDVGASVTLGLRGLNLSAATFVFLEGNGAKRAAGSVLVVSAESLSCVFSLVNLPTGFYDVLEQNANPSETARLPGAYQVVPRPDLVSIEPEVAGTGRDAAITLRGTGFSIGSRGWLTARNRAPVYSTNATLVSAQELLLTFPLAGVPAGARTVTIQSPAGATDSLVNALTLVVPPSVTVLSPNGGEAFETGASAIVQWSADSPSGLDHIDAWLSTDGGATFPLFLGTAAGDASSLAWTVPALESDSAAVRVTAFDVDGVGTSDESNALFHISGPTSARETRHDPTVRSTAAWCLTPVTRGGVSFRVETPVEARAAIDVFATGGSLRAHYLTDRLPPGRHAFSLATDYGAGVYMYRVSVSDRTFRGRFVVVR